MCWQLFSLVKAAAVATQAWTQFHNEIMRWMSGVYECHLCMDWSNLHNLYCLWTTCPCLSWCVVAQAKSKLPSMLQLESSLLRVSYMLTLHSGIIYGCKQHASECSVRLTQAHPNDIDVLCLFRLKTAFIVKGSTMQKDSLLSLSVSRKNKMVHLMLTKGFLQPSAKTTR